MTSQEAREKLEALVENSTTGVDIMAAVDVLMLAVHVEACRETYAGWECGQLAADGPPEAAWYCDEAKGLQGGNA